MNTLREALRITRNNRQFSLALLVFGIATTTAHAATTYRITDLGTLGGNESTGWAINNQGWVTGWAENASGYDRAFIYDGNSMQDLGTLGGRSSYGRGINDAGWVTGNAYTAGYDSHAFIYDGNSMQDLGTLGGDGSQGDAINNSGHVAGGSTTTGNSNFHTFLYDGTGMQDLGSFGANFTLIEDINDAGQIVGVSFFSSEGRISANLIDSNGVQNLWDEAYTGIAINNLGQVAGATYEVEFNNPTDMTDWTRIYTAMFYDGSTIAEITLPNPSDSFTVEGINDIGQFVGTSSSTGDAAYLYDGSALVDLNSLIDPSDALFGSVELLAAMDINNAGQITGKMTINGEEHAYLATPLMTPVPLPAAVWFMMPGLAFLGWMKGRNRGEAH